MTVGSVRRDMATESSTGNRLLALYRRFLGEPEREIEVYTGFALFFGGIALAALGLVLFFWSAAVPSDGGLYWQLREIAIVLAMLGLPAFALSVVVLLPVDRRAIYVGGGGAAICLVAVGVFVYAYPQAWNVDGLDYSAQGIAVYSGGLAVLVASTGAALVGYHLDRARGPSDAPTAPGQPEAADATGTADDDASVSDERVERDIEAAMEDAELTWGGVKKTETKRLRVDTGDHSDIDSSGFDSGSANTASGEGVDDAVAGLRALQGGDAKTGKSEGVDDQTAALTELRERRREDPGDRSTVDRLRERFGL